MQSIVSAEQRQRVKTFEKLECTLQLRHETRRPIP